MTAKPSSSQSRLFSSARQSLLVLILVAVICIVVSPARAQTTTSSAPASKGVIVHLNGISVILFDLLHNTSSTQLHKGDQSLYLVVSRSGKSDLQLLADLITDIVNVAGAELNIVVNFGPDADLNQSTASVLNQSTASVLNQSTASVLNGGTSEFYGSPVNSAYTSQSAIGQIAANNVHNQATGIGTLVADIDNGTDPGNLVLAPWLVPGWNFYSNSPDWSCWSNQSTASVLNQDGVSVLNPSADDQGGSVNQSTASVLNGSSVSVLNGSTVAVLNQSTASVLNGQIIYTPGNGAFMQMYAAHPEFGHGTAVMGLIHLLAPEAHLMPVKAFSPDGQGTLASVIESIYFATDTGANVINMSFSTTTDSPSMKSALKYAALHNVVLVASAGNDASNETVYPGGFESVLDVAAVDPNNNLASFSNYGPTVDLAAPGVGLITTFPDNLWAVVSGTSFSAPLVSGQALLVFQHLPSNWPVDHRILNSALRNVPADAGGAVGDGLIQVINSLSGPVVATPMGTSDGSGL